MLRLSPGTPSCTLSHMTPDPLPPSAEPPLTGPLFSDLDAGGKGVLLSLARGAIRRSIQGLGEPEPNLETLPAAAALPLGCFVTLTLDGDLKGCIGSVLPRLPLHRAIIRHAIQAAFEDRRFDPVTRAEIERLRIEISILSPLHPLRASSPQEILGRLRPHRDGVLLKLGGLGATYLPQVWESLPNPGNFMDSLARKAGLAASGWRDPHAEISTYEVTAFSENPDASGTQASKPG